MPCRCIAYLTRASVDAPWRFSVATLTATAYFAAVIRPGRRILWPPCCNRWLCCRLWLFSCGFWPLCCRIDGRCLATDVGASAALDCSAVADGSFDASVRPLLMPACADAETRTNAVIRINLRMRASGCSARRLERSILRLCELDHAGSEGTDVRSATLQTCFGCNRRTAGRPHNGCRVRGRSFHPAAIHQRGRPPAGLIIALPLCVAVLSGRFDGTFNIVMVDPAMRRMF